MISRSAASSAARPLIVEESLDVVVALRIHLERVALFEQLLEPGMLVERDVGKRLVVRFLECWLTLPRFAAG